MNISIMNPVNSHPVQQPMIEAHRQRSSDVFTPIKLLSLKKLCSPRNVNHHRSVLTAHGVFRWSVMLSACTRAHEKAELAMGMAKICLMLPHQIFSQFEYQARSSLSGSSILTFRSVLPSPSPSY
jgi:hypothetical protein